MRGRAAAVLTLMLAAGCSGGGDTAAVTSTIPGPAGAATPEAAVRSWIEAVSTGRYAAATDLVPGDQLAVIIGVENGLEPAAIATMADAGVSPGTLAEYWSGFEESFAEASGLAVTALDVGATERFETSDGSYAGVEIFFPSRIGNAEIITVEDAGRWRVDLMAVVGPSLVRPLRNLLVGLPQTAAGNTVRRLLAEMTPSLRAALARPGVDSLPLEFRAELVQLVGFLES